MTAVNLAAGGSNRRHNLNMEGLNDSLHLPGSFFAECEKHISNAKRYLTKDHTGYVRHKKWKLFAPENIKNIIDKGVSEYGTI